MSESAYTKADIDNAKNTERIGKRANRADRILAFCQLRSAGFTLADIAKRICVSYGTCQNYEKLYRDKRERAYLEAKAQGEIADKAEVARALTAIIRQESDTRDKIAASSGLSKVMGYDAPQRIQSEIRIIPQSVVAWIDTVALPDAPQAAPMLPDATAHALPEMAGGEPPTKAEAEAISPPTNFSTISEKAPR